MADKALTKKAIREQLAPLYASLFRGRPSGEGQRSAVVVIAGHRVWCERCYHGCPGRIGPVWYGHFSIEGLIATHPKHVSGGFSMAEAIDHLHRVAATKIAEAA